MPTIGDLIAKWANGRNALLRGEIEELRLKMNRIEAAASRLDTLSAPTGGLDPNSFRNSGGFSVLPHEAASMYNGTPQVIPTASDTTLLFDATSGATWSHGIGIDASTGRITVTGANQNTVLLLFAWGTWAANAGGTLRDIKLKSNDGLLVTDRHAGLGAAAEVFSRIVHIRRTPSATTYYYMDVNHNAGVNLNFDDFGFVVVRLR